MPAYYGARKILEMNRGVRPWLLPPNKMDGITPSLYADFTKGVYSANGVRKRFQDLFAMSSGSKVVIGPAGYLVTVPSNTPAFDYTSGVAQFLREGAATNLNAYSSTFTNAAYTKTGATADVNQGIAPDGTNSANSLTESLTTSTHQASINVTYTGNVTTCVSAYVKAGTGTLVQLGSGGAARGYANFDLSTGTLGTYSSSGLELVGVPQIQPIVNGWYRISMDLLAPAGGTIATGIFLSDSASAARSPSYLGTGKTILVWGFQTEAGTLPSSPIATSGSTVTRVTDICTPTAYANSAIQSANSSMVYRGDIRTLVASQSLIGLTGWSLLRSASSPTSQLVIDGSSGADVTLGTVFPGTIGAAFGWDASGRSGSVNGAAVASSATAIDKTVPPFYLGPDTGMPAGAMHALNAFLAWPIKGSDSALQSQARVYA